MLIAHLALEAPEHFGGDDVDALFGADIALAKWEDPRATDPAFLAACVLRASGLDEAERRAADARLTGTRAKKANPVDRAFSAASGRAASMFNLVLSALDMRGGAHAASLSVVFEEMPSARVAPDVVSHALARAACVSAGGDAGARRASGRRAPARAAPAERAANTDTDTLTRDASPSANAINLNAASLRVVYEDAHVVAVSKPAGVLTHEPKKRAPKKGAGRRRGFVGAGARVRHRRQSAVGAHVSGPGIVHRLDRPTTGVLLVAKTDEAHLGLVARWFQRRVRKTYLALTERHPGDVDARRLKTARAFEGRAAAPVDGKPARSDWRVLETFEGDESAQQTFALVEVRPLTGRKHQIRQHMGLELRAPLVLDPLYRNGQPSFGLPRRAEEALATPGFGTGTKRSKKKAKPGDTLFLHARSIELEHPITGEALVLEDPPPPAFEAVLEALRKEK